MIHSNAQPDPLDVCHVQFQSQIAFKLVWVPPEFTRFVLVDDDGALLNMGAPMGDLPPFSARRENYLLTVGSKYAVEANKEATRS